MPKKGALTSISIAFMKLNGPKNGPEKWTETATPAPKKSCTFYVVFSCEITETSIFVDPNRIL